VKKEAGVGFMRIEVKVVDPLGSEGRGSANQAMHLITLSKQKLGQV
jgi:hypothetical protein